MVIQPSNLWFIFWNIGFAVCFEVTSYWRQWATVRCSLVAFVKMVVVLSRIQMRPIILPSLFFWRPPVFCKSFQYSPVIFLNISWGHLICQRCLCPTNILPLAVFQGSHMHHKKCNKTERWSWQRWSTMVPCSNSAQAGCFHGAMITGRYLFGRFKRGD